MPKTSCCSDKRSFKDISIEALRSANCRLTKPRLAVIDCIASAEKPLSAPEIYEKLSKQSKEAPLDKVSVYRILEALLELQLLHRVPHNGGYIACTHNDCQGAYHVLSRCTECDAVQEVDVPNDLVAPLLAHMKNSLDFTPDSHLLHMDGVCLKCSQALAYSSNEG